MSSKSRTRRKSAGRAPDSNRCARRSASVSAKAFAEREAAVSAGEQVVLGREEAARLREEATRLREEAARLREVAARLREKALRAREKASAAKAALKLFTEAQLREANERLVVATVHSHTMTDAAEEATARISYMAEHDILTGLPNRSVLTDRLGQAIVLAQRHSKKVALMYLDVDNFKHINDSLGHGVGDQLLQSIAERLRATSCCSDTVSRQGGDEFVVLLPEVEQAQDAARIAEKLIEAMAAPHLIGGHQLYVTLSIGFSIYPDDGKDTEALVMNADIAMYHVKKGGRNNYQRFTPDMNVRAVARQSVEAALRRALEEREFVLHYQPKVNLETGAITGAEALLRWQRSDQIVSPTEFVRIAEECGLILPIGKWVLREACRQAAAWLQAGLDIGQIAVNVSAAEFRDKAFLAGVRATLDDTGLDPRRLEVEVTESGLMQDTEPTMAALRSLKDLGVRIAIDDFGTGYSCLSYLRRFPIDTLKIDQSFVQGIDASAGEAIVSAVIAMGLSLKQRVVAEGVETSQQVAYLQSQRCAEGQGFFFSRPVVAEEFSRLLANGALTLH